MNQVHKTGRPVRKLALVAFVAFVLFLTTFLFFDDGKGTALAAPPCIGASCITVDGSQTFQTMDGWEATSWAGQEAPTGWGSYTNTLITKAVEDLGINRIRLEIRSGVENPVDTWQQYRDCTDGAAVCEAQWRAVRYQAVNDNSDANSVNSSGFKYSEFDDTITNLVIPLRQKLQARGESLYINVNYVDFDGSTGMHANNPAEYGEFVLNTYQHMQSVFGFVPDSWEVALEPDNTGATWTPIKLAAAMKAAGDRLSAAGFTPRFVAPSVTNAGNAVSYIDAIANTVGAMQYVDTFSYHLYGGQSDSILQDIANKAGTYNKKTAQLEFIGANYQHLQNDLKIAKNSSWAQYTFGGPTPDDGGGYFYVTGNTVNMGQQTTLLRQYFKYIRRGAQRIGVTNSGNPFLDPLAFRNTDGKHVVVTPVAGQTFFGINGLPAGTYGIFYTTLGYVTTNLPNQAISTGEAVSLTNIPPGVVTVYATTASAPPPSTTVATPSISPDGGSFSSAQSVTLATSTSGATIRYTTNGTTPTDGIGTIYVSPFSVASTTTVKAIAYKSGSVNSSVASATFTITAPGGGGGGGGSTPPAVLSATTGTRLVNSNGTFYFVEGGLRKGITSPGIMYACGFEFKDAKPATSADLALPTSLLLPCSGSLVKSAEDPTVYLISGNQRYAFTSAQVFLDLGFKFSSVLLVTNPELQALGRGANLDNATAAHLPGTDINVNGTIYWIDGNSQKQAYPSLDIYNSWHVDGDFSTVVPVNANDLGLTTGGNLSLRVF